MKQKVIHRKYCGNTGVKCMRKEQEIRHTHRWSALGQGWQSDRGASQTHVRENNWEERRR